MEYNQFECDVNGEITGVSPNCDVRIGAMAKPFLTDYDFEFATIDAANDSTAWATAIENEDVYPLPLVEEMDNNSEGATKYTSPITGNQKTVKKGKTSETVRIEFIPCLHRRLQAFAGKKGRIIWVDVNNNVIGTSPDDVVFKGLEINSFDLENWLSSDGSNLSFTPFSYTYTSNVERENQISTFEADFNIKELNGIQPAKLTEVGSTTALEITVDVKGACDAVAVSGLTVDDFIFIESDGVTEETITLVTESPSIPGRYSLVGLAFETGGTVNLYDQTDSDYVVTVGTEFYKGTAITVTI